jgi:hypothetical protein
MIDIGSAGCESCQYLFYFVVLIGACTPSKAGQTANVAKRALTNGDVVRMVQAKFDDATIVKAIEAQGNSFDVSVDALLKLKEAGVSQSVIQAMLSSVGGGQSYRQQSTGLRHQNQS